MKKTRDPIEREWAAFLKRENRTIARMEKSADPFWEKKLDKVVPEKLHETLETAFCKGFRALFNSGTGLLEKTFSREKLEAEFKVREYAQEQFSARKNLTAGRKAAGRKMAVTAAGVGAEGAVLGLLGIGLPDIPLFLGVLLRSLYTLELHYGIDYERDEERELLLDLIALSLKRGEGIREEDARMNRRLYGLASAKEGHSPASERAAEEENPKEGTAEFVSAKENPAEDAKKNAAEPGSPKEKPTADSLRNAANALADELLYLKFLQGLPIVGVLGGLYDGPCLKKITDYVSLKLERRYLLSKMESGGK